MGREACTYEVGHEGLVDGGGVGCSEDEVSASKVSVFLICLKNGDQVPAEVFGGGGGGDGLQEVVGEGRGCKVHHMACSVQSGDSKQVLNHCHKLPKLFRNR